MTRRRVGLVGLLMVLLAGCVAETPIPDRSPPASSASIPVPRSADAASVSVVPWSAETPPPSDSGLPAPSFGSDPVVCSSDALRLDNAGWQGAGGAMAGGFVLWNAGAAPCSLTGRPRVTIVDGAGPLDVIDRPTPDADRTVILGPNQEAPVLHEELATGLGSVRLFWSNWCGRDPVEPLGLVVQIGEGRSRLPVESGGSTPRCDAPSGGSAISVGPYALSPGPEPTEPPPLLVEALELTLVVPVHAISGQVLRYVAILRNPTGAAIELLPCPVFMERLNTRGGPVIAEYLLACTDVPSIAAGESVSFAMELAVPAGLPADPDAALVWSLDPFHGLGLPPRSPDAKVGIAVVSG